MQNKALEGVKGGKASNRTSRAGSVVSNGSVGTPKGGSKAKKGRR